MPKTPCNDNYPKKWWLIDLLTIFYFCRYFPGPGSKVFEMHYQLPKDLTCKQCVFQWRYVAGNNWGKYILWLLDIPCPFRPTGDIYPVSPVLGEPLCINRYWNLRTDYWIKLTYLLIKNHLAQFLSGFN